MAKPGVEYENNVSTNLLDTYSSGTEGVAPSLDKYKPVYHHWFHTRDLDVKMIWQPFSVADSLILEKAFTSSLHGDNIIATDGGRYDVDIVQRKRTPVYWTGAATKVRRCSWFYKSSVDGKLVPYEEDIADTLEREFKIAFESNEWNRKVTLTNGEAVIFHSPNVLVLFPSAESAEEWGNASNQMRPSVVKRGVGSMDIDKGEPVKVDHLLFLVHGIGSVCDLKFRTVEEVVDEFRSVCLQLVRSHYQSSCENGLANRIEVLPISWHQALHSEETDKKLQSITLESIPRLRGFTNGTILDVLFYTSPVYCQTIIRAVGDQLNAVYDLFKKRNPSFNGGVSLGGHSLGSLILFDLLSHQHPENEREFVPHTDDDTISALNEPKPDPTTRKMSRRISYMMGAVGTGQAQIYYPHLVFQPKAFFALGSPIGMFVTVRGLNTLGVQFELPTCPAFFNIFHPFDPVAYRIESLINPELANLKPVLIPHHKGRKRMHLELRETMARVGADLKQKVVDSMKNTLQSFYQFTTFNRQTPVLKTEMPQETNNIVNDTNYDYQQQEYNPALNGILNKGRRIDYVLQEAPLEFFNEYIFALASHVCYWESEDTMLLIIKEIYGNLNISTDNQIPQQSLSIERETALQASTSSSRGIDLSSLPEEENGLQK